MKVKEIMTASLETTRPEATLKEAATQMKENDIGSLPVIQNGKLVGMVTDRDLVIRGMAAGRDPGQTPVQEVMSADAICCSDEQDVKDAAKLMQQRQLRRLPVLNRENKPVGILSLGDLARQTDTGLAGGTLQQVSM
ncbi:MAG: CBS domain-containing protein [Candidatus Acidiferrales bacterium]